MHIYGGRSKRPNRGGGALWTPRRVRGLPGTAGSAAACARGPPPEPLTPMHAPASWGLSGTPQRFLGAWSTAPPTCRQEGFAMAGFQRSGDLPADAHQPDVWRAMRTLDSARPPPSPSLAPWRREGVSPSHGLP
jgi:hypothetical protein